MTARGSRSGGTESAAAARRSIEVAAFGEREAVKGVAKNPQQAIKVPKLKLPKPFKN